MTTSNVFKLLIFSILIIFSTEIAIAQQATVTIHQDSKIPELLALKKELEKNNKLGEGFTIQLYYGESGKANSVIRKFESSYSAWPVSLEYETPNFKVWVGDFDSRLEADRALLEIKDTFPSAFILKPLK